jgi:hypothetical protein
MENQIPQGPSGPTAPKPFPRPPKPPKLKSPHDNGPNEGYPTKKWQGFKSTAQTVNGYDLFEYLAKEVTEAVLDRLAAIQDELESDPESMWKKSLEIETKSASEPNFIGGAEDSNSSPEDLKNAGTNYRKRIYAKSKKRGHRA